MLDYIQQKHDSTCAVISLLNAKRFYGFDTPTYGDDEFEELIDLAKARHGSAIYITKIAERLGLKRTKIKRELAHKYFPFEFSCFPPFMRVHSALSVGGSSKVWILVNYQGPNGPLIEKIRVADIDFVPVFDGEGDFRQIWHIALKGR